MSFKIISYNIWFSKHKQKERTTSLLINIAENNYLNLFVGIFLCYCGLNEAWGALHEDIRSLNFGAHHGIIVIGLINTFKSLSHIIKGTKT